MKQKTIGIIGGGQLARMLSMAAARLGFNVIILDPNNKCPANQVAKRQIIENHNNIEALNDIASLCDYITYESENIPIESIEYLSKIRPVYPSSNAIMIAQDRLYEKRFFQDAGLNTATFYEINSQKELSNVISKTTEKGILKTRRMGYDGKGQKTYNPGDPIDNLYSLLGNNHLIFENFIKFEKEISIIAARATDGSICIYDPIENQHIDGILHKSIVPANISIKTSDLAQNATEKILNLLNYIGVLCVEFFVTHDEQIIVNEMAPRVHNSGHWTEAACTISQFEQHIRSISHLPIINPYRHSNCVMHNLLGFEITQIDKWLKCNASLIHIYGKSKALPKRKMGHVTQILPKN
ncbi:5-(carboxyamino)imidazole ribonucleotide synthase [Candidatus Liberibacter americanus]|uniref:N5-carboxyaminoimidazole ribonucleotide synthase n=1 Tax=Candidatus Liberibacter americanus str. Sao Paulo TaxID=1261131 RepID=U6B5B6_9HYPH|nr:5-(carboxyamino)imidazole ribonucleotide synthase [Candidatus Liberibacter americanus]AHA27808.1 Phosphoribosylaminoimidazole carboxylase [Candidatus Liberibacter americanus str. Sao Paulo]EMS36192.1 phosphoribosylaminoimidazole carboxylase ATPase subunit [Candidatus Liberibacter americanus PW_SP]